MTKENTIKTFKTCLTALLLSYTFSSIAFAGESYLDTLSDHNSNPELHRDDLYLSPNKRYARKGYHNTQSKTNLQAPRHIKEGQLKDHYYDKSYHKGHDHYHQIYSFSYQQENNTWVLRPFVYCEGEVFATGYFGDDGRIYLTARFY